MNKPQCPTCPSGRRSIEDDQEDDDDGDDGDNPARVSGIVCLSVCLSVITHNH